LDDVFLALTGHGEAAPEDQDLVLDTVRSPV
jgi:hypothetical protein